MNQQQGTCPVCGEEGRLDYGLLTVQDEWIYYPYICRDCGFEGQEWYMLDFHNHLTKEGKEIEDL